MKENIVDIMDMWLDGRLDDLHTIIPGEIVEYSGHKERNAKVQPLIKIRTSLNKVVQIDPIENVPVMFPSSSAFNMLYPLKKGDGVLLVFSESSIGNFLSQGGIQEADDANRFDLTDCIAIPGLYSFKKVPDIKADDAGFILQFQDTKIIIEDKTNNFIIEDKNGNKITVDSNGILLEDLTGNTVEMTGITTTINGNLEVTQ